MEELYSETYVPARPSLGRLTARYGLILLCFLIAFIDLFVLGSIPGIAFVVLIDGIIIMFLPKTKVAYEYVFVDGQIDFDLVINSENRKHKRRIDMDKVDLAAPEEDPVLYNSRNVPLTDYSSRKPEDKHFILLYRSESGQQRIRFTPDEKMLEFMKLKGRNRIHC